MGYYSKSQKSKFDLALLLLLYEQQRNCSIGEFNGLLQVLMAVGKEKYTYAVTGTDVKSGQ